MAMKINTGVRKWSELRGLNVMIPSEGKKAGTVDDFYFDAESSEIYALRIKIGLGGYRALTSNAISTIGPDSVTVANPQMLIDERHDGRLPVLRLGTSLPSYKVLSESGTFVGTVGNILLAIDPPVALRITGFELAGGRRNQIFSAHEIISYGHDVITILDQVAKKLT
jgi:sporulation protein YlmC with PRC-barrel domain